VVDAGSAEHLDVQAGLDASGKLISFNVNHYSTVGPGGRLSVGALLAGLPTMAAPMVVPLAGSFSGTSYGISDPWMYDQVPNARQKGFRTYNIGGGTPADPTTTRRRVWCAGTACAPQPNGSRTSGTSR
jgi:hypothetical protein